MPQTRHTGTLAKVRLAFELLGYGSTFVALVSAAATYVLGMSIGLDQTTYFRDFIDEKVVPLANFGEAEIVNANVGFISDPNTTHEMIDDLVVETVGTFGKSVEIIDAVRNLDRMIECKKAISCVLLDYDVHEDVIRRFWFTYRAFILQERSHQRANFGVALEQEATRIIADERASGNLPRS